MRKRKPANLACDELMERIAFIHDLAGAISKDSIRNWRGWRGSAELHCHALMMDLDDIVSRLDALIRGQNAPFEGPEWVDWKAKRDARRKIN